MSLEILVLQALKKINPPTRQIVNGASGGISYVGNLGIAFSERILRVARQVYSGVVNANVPKTLLSVSGAGELNFFALTQRSTNQVRLTVQVTIDGVIAFNLALAPQSFNAYLLPVVGTVSGDIAQYGDRAIYGYDKVIFSNSLLIEITQDLTLPDEYTAFLAYKTY